MSDASLVLVGDSHVKALKDAAKELSIPLVVEHTGPGGITDNFCISDAGGARILNPLVSEALRRAELRTKRPPEETDLLLSYGAAENHRVGLSQQFLNSTMRTDEEGTFYAPSLIRSLIEHRLRLLKEGLAIIAGMGFRSVTLVGGPPPHRKKADIADPRGWAAIPRHSWRLDSFEIIREGLATACELTGVSWTDVTTEAADGDGFLRAAFTSDGIHASADFGSLLFRSLMDHGLKEHTF